MRLAFVTLCVAAWTGSGRRLQKWPTGPRTRTCDLLINERDECGWLGMGEVECLARGCCWEPSERAPWCYRTGARCPYRALDQSPDGLLLQHGCAGGLEDIFGSELLKFQTQPVGEDGLLRVRIEPADGKKFAVPDSLYPPLKPANDSLFDLQIAKDPFSFKVRLSGDVLFDSSAASLVMQDYYVSFGTSLPDGCRLYGLGYRAGPLQRPPGRRYALFSRDASTLPSAGNLYTASPLYLCLYRGEDRSQRAYGMVPLLAVDRAD